MSNFRSKAALLFIANSISVLKPPCPVKRLMFAGNQFEQFRIFTTSNGVCQHSCFEALQRQIVNALHAGDRSKASTLLSELSRTNKELKTSDFVLILQKCARLPDPLFALETWKLMKQNHIHIVGKCYLYAVQALSKGGYLEEAFSLMSLLAEKPDIYPLLPVYNNFLSASVQTGSIQYVNDCLDRMEQHMIGKSEITYAELLKLAVLQGNLSAVHEIWNEFIKYYSLSIIFLQKFVWSFSMLRDVGSAYVALQHMVALGFQRKSVLQKTVEGKFSESRLDIPIPSCSDTTNLLMSYQNNGISPYHDNSKDEDASRGEYSLDLSIKSHVVQGIGTPGALVSGPAKKFLRWSFSDVIHACANTGDYTLAEQLMSQMQNLGLEPSSGTYEGYLRAVVEARGFLDGVEVIKVMRQKNVMPYDSSLAFMSVSCSQSLELDLAEFFLEQISKCTTLHPYNALLEACDVLDQPERGLRVLAKLKISNLQPDIRTYELLFSLFGNVNAPYEEGNIFSQMLVSKRINAIESDMMKNEVPHSQLSFRNLTKALGSEGMMKELIQYLHLAESPYSGLYKFLRSSTYNAVLQGIFESNRVYMAADVFRGMKECGIAPDRETYTIMIHCCCTGRRFNYACAIVSMMIRDGFNPDTTTYTLLIEILFRLKRYVEAIELFNKGIVDGVEPDVVSYNTIIKALTRKNGGLKDIELIVEQMHRRKIKPDLTTCRVVLCTYYGIQKAGLGIRRRRYTTALEALQVMSLRLLSGYDDDSNIIIAEIEREFSDLIISEEPDIERKLIKMFKQGAYKDDEVAALLFLRWCAMHGSSVSWSPNQESKWANRLSNDYDTYFQNRSLFQLDVSKWHRKFVG